MAAVIGALRAELSASIAQFEQDMGRAGAAVGRFAGLAQRHASRIQSAGTTMTAALTAPIAAFGIATARVAGDFESTMNRVQGATSATTAQMQAMTRAARDFGRDRSFTATARQAADVMEILARNGVAVENILGGAARATLTLAAATGAEFGPAADVATAVMQQFGRSAQELPGLVDNITGTLLASRFGFEDYAQAIAQGGGVAAAAGVSFEEFNAAIAATSTQFSSGSDAGTSFKTFVQRLVPQSREAREEMQRLRLSFYDAQGQMRPMAEIAGQLQARLGGLSEQARNESLTTIFGSDAFRTAVGLMQAGSAGIEQLTATIARASAQEQMEIRMRGLNGALTQLRRSAENLALAIGESGLLEGLANLVRGLGGLLDRMSALPRPVLAFITAVAGIAAVVGPVLVAVGAITGAVANLAPLMAPLGAAMAAVGAVLTGPFGLAIAAAVAAVVIFREQIGQVLGFLAGEAARVLGPTFQAIIGRFIQLWNMLSTGPIAAAVGGFLRIVGNIGAIIATVMGQQAIVVIATFLTAMERMLTVAVGVVSTLTRLFAGDFSGALNAALGTIDTFTGGAASRFADMATNVIRSGQNMANGFAQMLQRGFTVAVQVAEAILPGLPAAVANAAREAARWAMALVNGIRGVFERYLAPVINMAMGMINNLNRAFAVLTGRGNLGATLGQRGSATPGLGAGLGERGRLPPVPAAPPGAPGGGGAAGGGGGGRSRRSPAAAQAERDARQVETARQRLAEGIRDLNDQLANGLGGRELPQATQRAEALRRRLVDLTEDAGRAGVNTQAFAGQVGALRTEIQRLETEGLEEEARTFGRTVDESARAVREFAQGGLPPLQARLQEVDDTYERLRARIQAQIDANAGLATRNAAAAASMANLRTQLEALTRAHTAATEAATAQFNAERRIADLQSQAAVAGTQREIRDLRRSANPAGAMTESQQQLQAIQDNLDQQRLAAAIRLAELEAQLAAARQTGDVEQIARLTQQVATQRELHDLVSATQATQIQGAQRIQQASEAFSTGMTDALADMVVRWEFDTRAITTLVQNLLRDALIKPLLEMAANWAVKAIGSFMSGGGLPGFANGGSFNVGNIPGAGIDHHLVAFRARTGENVTVSKPGEVPGVVVEGDGGGAAGLTIQMQVDARGAGLREVDLLERRLDDWSRNFKERVWDATNEGLMRKKVAPPTFG